MKANELRIGNLIGCDGNILIVEKIDKQNNIGCSLLEKSKGQHVNSGNKYFIQLTEEWLFKFGFENNTEEMVFYGNNIVIYWRKFENHIEINGEKYFKKYVHQLQNLYFSLTEEELIIK